MYSININGKVERFRYTPFDSIEGYYFYVGDQFVGKVFKRGNWNAVSFVSEDRLVGLRRVPGFKTRYDAAEYLLRVGGFIDRRG